MKRFLVPTILAACVATTVAFAANERVTVSFQTLQNSGVSGELTLMSLPNGGTMIHGKIRGLTKDSDYTSNWYTDGSCGATPGTELTRFRAKENGTANFNIKTDRSISDIESISIFLNGETTLLACAPVTQD